MNQNIKEIVAGGLVVFALMAAAFGVGFKSGSRRPALSKNLPSNIMAGCYMEASTNRDAGFFGYHNIALAACGALALTNLDFVAGGFPIPGVTNLKSSVLRCKMTEEEYSVLSAVIMRASLETWNPNGYQYPGQPRKVVVYDNNGIGHEGRFSQKDSNVQ